MDERLKALGTEVWDVGSARAKALIQLAEQGLECFSMPDFFHVVHEIVKRYSLTIGRRLRQAHKELQKAAEALAQLQGLAHAAHDSPEATVEVEARRAEVLRFHGISRLADGTRDVDYPGGKFNMSDVSARLGLEQLPRGPTSGTRARPPRRSARRARGRTERTERGANESGA